MSMLDSVLKNGTGESKNVIRVSFKKTVNIRQYETEAIEGSTEITLDKELSGAERILVETIARAECEYEVFVNLLCKGHITQTEFDERKKSLDDELKIMANKAASVIGQEKVKQYFDE